MSKEKPSHRLCDPVKPPRIAICLPSPATTAACKCLGDGASSSAPPSTSSQCLLPIDGNGNDGQIVDDATYYKKVPWGQQRSGKREVYGSGIDGGRSQRDHSHTAPQIPTCMHRRHCACHQARQRLPNVPSGRMALGLLP